MGNQCLGKVNGMIPSSCGLDEAYFMIRDCYVDCRGPLNISSMAHFGIGVKIITTSHSLGDWPVLGGMTNAGVTVHEGAWVASYAILHDCEIGAHAIVSLGAVVSGMKVPPYAVVAGNPAKIVGRMHKGQIVPYYPGPERP